MTNNNNVFFATPTLTNAVKVDYFLSATATQQLLMKEKLKSYWCFLPCTFIGKARGILASDFLRTDCENLFFLDDDIGWPAHKILEFINRPEDVVLGAYPMKREQGGFPIRLHSDTKGHPIWNEEHNLVKAEASPGGFMRIKRHVIEKLAETVPQFIAPSIMGNKELHYDLFPVGHAQVTDKDGNIHNLYRGEDISFCYKVLDAGYEIWCDPDIEFTHAGINTWKGKLLSAIDEAVERGQLISLWSDDDPR